MKTKKSKKIQHNRTDTSNQFDHSERLEEVQCLEKFLQHLFRNYTFYSESIDDYNKRKKPSLRRRVIYHTITVNAFIASLLYLALLIHNNEDDIQYLGAPITLIFTTEFNRIAYFICFITSCVIVVNRLCLYNFESWFIYLIDDLYQRMKVRIVKNNKKNNQFDLDSYSFLAKSLAGLFLSHLLYLFIYSSPVHMPPYSDLIMFIVNLAMFSIWVKDVVDASMLGIICKAI